MIKAKVLICFDISTGAIVKNLASNVNLSHYINLWTLGSKLQENNCWTFFQ